MYGRTRTRRGMPDYRYIAGGLLLGFIIVYYVPDIFKGKSTGWHMYPREWVQAHNAISPASSFKYVTYNILNSHNMRKSLDRYGNSPSEFLNLTIRQTRLLVEVETMNPDVMCVQEIDQVWYDSYWFPQLSARGYDGMSGMHESHPNKVGQAIFWRKRKFNFVSSETPWFVGLMNSYIKNTALEGDAEFDGWIKRRSRLPLVELQEVNSRLKVIVGCTHISASREEAPAMQTLQIALALQRMDAFSQTTGTKALILSGDFNTHPYHPAYQFIKTGSITESIKKELEKNTPLETLKPAMKKFALDVLNMVPAAFTHKLTLQSAYHTVMGAEPMTTAHGDKTLDYIWYTPDRLGVSGTLREPDKTESIRNKRREAYELFGSDHIPLKVQFYLFTKGWPL